MQRLFAPRRAVEYPIQVEAIVEEPTAREEEQGTQEETAMIAIEPQPQTPSSSSQCSSISLPSVDSVPSISSSSSSSSGSDSNRRIESGDN